MSEDTIKPAKQKRTPLATIKMTESAGEVHVSIHFDRKISGVQMLATMASSTSSVMSGYYQLGNKLGLSDDKLTRMLAAKAK